MRLKAARVLIPLMLLGFFSTRLPRVTEWIGASGFQVPDLGGHWTQPLYIPPLADPLAIVIAIALTISLLCVALGRRVLIAGPVAVALLTFVALADRLAAFTVTKLAPVLVAVLVYAAWQQSRDEEDGDAIRFFQWFLAVFYMASGLCKYDGDWAEHTHLIWTHLHSSYETAISYYVGLYTPEWAWKVLQYATLAFELGAPLWFSMRRTRTAALLFGLVMHASIGLLFGPVVWFSLLMMTLLLVAWAPDTFWEAVGARVRAVSPTPREPDSSEPDSSEPVQEPTKSKKSKKSRKPKGAKR